MAKQREEVLNAKLGELLIERHPRWNEANVFVESTGVVRGHLGWKIDVLLAAAGQPVAIEAKLAAGQVDDLDRQIEERLGEVVAGTDDVIESGLTLVYAQDVTAGSLVKTDFRYAVHRYDGSQVTRWPESGWTTGSIDDLATAVEIVSLSERRIRLGEQTLERGVEANAERLTRQAEGSEVLGSIGEVLHQEAGLQTTRMAVAILVNAFVFHYAIERSKGIPAVESGRGASGYLKSKVLDGWNRVLKVNYWPIFSISQAVLEAIPAIMANPLLNRMNEMAEELLSIGAATFHDLAGRMFQTLITDRKFLATFYTLPTSAALLADVAAARLDVDWADAHAIKQLRVADFACGTGALLSALQRSVYRRHRRAGGDDKSIHRDVMERVLVGTDIMPAATHLTANMLSSAHPRVGYGRSLVQALPYGLDQELAGRQKRKEKTVYIGALDLLGEEFMGDLFGEYGVELGGKRMVGVETDAKDDLPARHGSFDLVIMNPPFTRPNANRQKTDGAVPIPSFAGFHTSADEQRAMAEKLQSYKSRFAFGHAGLAANFMDLAHVKLKPEGIMALILPATFTSGSAWRKARRALENDYDDVDILSIATARTWDTSFSADTGIAECMVVARKKSEQRAGRPQVGYFNLPNRPASLLEANQMAARVAARVGVVEGTLSQFGLAQVADAGVGEVMVGLAKGVLRLPQESAFTLAIAYVRDLATAGLDSQMINGKAQNGPFIIKSANPGAKPYKTLWGHHAGRGDGDRERRLEVLPDSYGVVRKGLGERALEMWGRTASRVHANRDFRVNSQSLALCVTPEPTMGWTSVADVDPPGGAVHLAAGALGELNAWADVVLVAGKPAASWTMQFDADEAPRVAYR